MNSLEDESRQKYLHRGIATASFATVSTLQGHLKTSRSLNLHLSFAVLQRVPYLVIPPGTY